MAQRSNTVLVGAAVVVAAGVIIYAVVGRKPQPVKEGPEAEPAPSQQEGTGNPPPTQQPDEGVTHIDQTTDTTTPPDTTPDTKPDNQPDKQEPANSAGAPALFAPAKRGDADAIRALIDAGADPDATDQTGRTALMVAAEAGQVDTVFALLNAGADMKLRDNTRRSARDYALARYDQAGQTIARILGEAEGPGPVQDPAEK